MRPKAICDLAQLSDERLFEEVAKGLELVFENSMRIYSDACQLADKRNSRGHRILCLIAEEEAAKYLILLDAIRCQRTNTTFFSRQLKRYNDHLAKGIYIEYAWTKPSTFGEVDKWINRQRQEYYLDGPNDVDWVFRNRVVQQREEAMYVDYIKSDGENLWLSPSRYDVVGLSGLMPAIVKLVQALNGVGFANAQALAKIASIWRSVQMVDSLNWYDDLRGLNIQTLEKLNESGLLKEQREDAYAVIIDLWLFPLYQLELEMVKVDKTNLHEECDRYWANHEW